MTETLKVNSEYVLSQALKLIKCAYICVFKYKIEFNIGVFLVVHCDLVDTSPAIHIQAATADSYVELLLALDKVAFNSQDAAM